MRARSRQADLVDAREGRLERRLDTGQRGDVVDRPVNGPFGARAVVAEDVDEEGVLQLAERRERLDEPADFVVGVLQEVGEVFSLPPEEQLLVAREAVPGGDLRRPAASQSRTAAKAKTSRPRPSR